LVETEQGGKRPPFEKGTNGQDFLQIAEEQATRGRGSAVLGKAVGSQRTKKLVDYPGRILWRGRSGGNKKKRGKHRVVWLQPGCTGDLWGTEGQKEGQTFDTGNGGTKE